MAERILLMTSTINPRKGEPLLQRIDPQLRLNDYKKALKHNLQFLGKGLDKIVFVDNSDANLNELHALCENHKQDVELVSYYGLDYPMEHGRGYGEFKLLDFAMKTSILISNASDDAQILKITGRYLILNFEPILTKLPTADLYCNYRNYPVKWADMFFTVWRKSFYQNHLREVYLLLKMDENEVAPEVTFRNYLESLPNDTLIRRRFNVIPKIDAPKGMNNQNYRNFFNQAKFYSRVFINRLLPWLWI